MREIPSSTKAGQIFETAPGEYAIYGMKLERLPNSGDMLSVQDLEHPIATIKFGPGLVHINDILAIIIDRRRTEASNE